MLLTIVGASLYFISLKITHTQPLTIISLWFKEQGDIALYESATLN